MKDEHGFVSFHPKKEPVAWVTVGIVVLQLVSGLLTHNFDTSLVTALISALGGAGIRTRVWSPASHDAAVNNAVTSLAAAMSTVPAKDQGDTPVNSTIDEDGHSYTVLDPSDFPDGDSLDSVLEDKDESYGK